MSGWRRSVFRILRGAAVFLLLFPVLLGAFRDESEGLTGSAWGLAAGVALPMAVTFALVFGPKDPRGGTER
ncbi:hypothetical protein SAMN05421810_11158 [Amycolatopsis arida]|uniref:Uncharacterized protein n=1 Tax=Amycolatopsis arida TaxID=587909 RepID=A0A1I6A3T5_9PSEU|nr:hypothetical protein [Amycolatopsis arida]TDX88633.1 hypothetical protein CLV69_111155 [Amycolatopsis arida]SFQ63384.1 hypothetical protein SAMN05421810_11158 [Amycolatopsis arida]